MPQNLQTFIIDGQQFQIDASGQLVPSYLQGQDLASKRPPSQSLNIQIPIGRFETPENN